MKLSRFKSLSAKMSLAAFMIIPNIVNARPTGTGGAGGASGGTTDKLDEIAEVGFVAQIISTVAPIVGFIFWAGILVFAIVFSVKFVMAIVNYVKAPGDDTRAKDEAKQQIIQSGIALLVVAMMGPLINLILGVLGWDMIKQFFELDTSILVGL